MSPAIRRWLLLSGILTLVWLGFAHAGGTQLGNSFQIERDFTKGGVKGKLADLMANRDKKKEKDFPADIMDAAAKYYVYRVTWPAVLDAKSPDAGGSDPVVLHINDFHNHIDKQVF